MRRISILVVLTFAFFVDVEGQNLLKGKVLIPDAQVYDFGIVKQIDGPVSHTFKLTNASNKELVIYDVVPECSCTEPVWDAENIKPNTITDVVVGFKADHYPGEFDKLITVYTSIDTLELQIIGKVLPRPLSDIQKAYPFNIGGLRFEKDLFSMNSVFDNKVKSKEFMVFNDSSVSISSLEFKNLPDYISVNVDESLKANSQAKITIVYDPVILKDYGYITDYVNVIVGLDSMEMPVMANVSPFIPNYTKEQLSKAPKLSLDVVDYIALGKVKTNTVTKKVVKVKNYGKSDLKILKIKPACKCITSDLTDSFVLKPNQSKNIVLSFNSSGRVGKSRKSVYIYSNDPKSPAKIIKMVATVIE